MNEELKEIFIKQMLLPKEELALQVMELMADKMILQERIDKAVEYIKEWQSFPHTNCTTHKELKNLSNILMQWAVNSENE